MVLYASFIIGIAGIQVFRLLMFTICFCQHNMYELIIAQAL